LDGSWTGLKSIGRSFQDNRGCESASKEPEAADWLILPAQYPCARFAP